jgi:uncharacterized protein (TIGR02118 family)
MMGGMVTVSVLYPKHDGSRFDHDYYLKKHIPLVAARWGAMGLVKAELLKGSAALDGGGPGFELMAFLTFDSSEAMRAALAAHGDEIIADIVNFTNVQPVIQVNEPLNI